MAEFQMGEVQLARKMIQQMTSLRNKISGH
jgi:hypothetical protein